MSQNEVQVVALVDNSTEESTNPPPPLCIPHATAEEAVTAFWRGVLTAASERGELSAKEAELPALDDPCLGGLDEDGEGYLMTLSDHIAGAQAVLDERGIWGYSDSLKNEIHYVVKLPFSEEHLIEFFAHELGHLEPDRIEDGDLEEKAHSYQRVAVLAYRNAKQVQLLHY